MAPIEGVTHLQGDITHAATAAEVISHFDGARKGSLISEGLHDLDAYVQSQLILAALTIVTHILKPGGNFVAKVFRGKDISLLYSQLTLFFDDVTCAKPKSSRNSSVEAFVVCRWFQLPEGFEPKLLAGMLSQATEAYDMEQFSLANQRMIPFVACGDLHGWDADQNYDLEEGKEILEPTQPPTEPAYKTAIEQMKKRD